jgi:hypothetical protein
MAHFARMLVVIGIVFSCEPLFAQLPTSRLDVISPAAAKIGSEVEVTLSGAELDEADNLVFTNPGITATQKLSVPDEIDTTAVPMPRQFIVKIASDVAPGVYEVRATGPLGATNPRAFAVGNLETISESGNHRTLPSAMELPLGVAVTGTVDPGAVDFYAFSANKSQRLLIDCYGQRLGSRIDATLVLYNSDGTRIKQVRDVAQLDPIIEFVAPEDGDYYIGVYDFEYNGGNEYFYRLTVHESPFVSFVFPPVAPPGGTATFKTYGHHLPGAKPVDGMIVADNSLEELSVDVAMGDPPDSHVVDMSMMETPTSSPLARKLFQLETPQGTANAVAIGYATAPVWLEQEPNNQAGEAQRVDTPCEFVGQFYPRGDRDVISFDAKKGDVYWLELLSNRLGVPSDAQMLIEKIITNEKGEQQVSLVAEVDDRKPTVDGNSMHVYFSANVSDPSYKLTADADATYRVTIMDLFGNTNNDPRFVYRLLIRQELPDFGLLAYAAPISANKNQVSPSVTILPRGGNTTMAVRVLRQHGFEGNVEISAAGLPDGVICHGAVAGGNDNQVSLVFSAPENASAWTGPVRVVGKATIDDREVTRQARAGAVIWGTQNAQQQQPDVRIVSNVMLSVLDRNKAPLSVQLGDGKPLETSRGGKLEIPIKAVRGEDIPDDLKMKMIGIAGVNLKETTVKGNEGKYPLEVTAQNFPTGLHTVLLTGTTKYKYAGDTEAIKKAEQESKRLEEVVKKFAELEKQAQENLRQAKEAAAKEKENQALADEAKKAEEESKRRSDLSKRAVQRKQETDKKLNDTKNKNKPRDINIPFVSTPLRLQVVASPVTLKLDAPPKLKQGEKADIAATIDKRFDFDDRVDVTVELPGGVTGISVKPLNIEKGKTDGKLELVLADNATPGTHVLKVRTKLKFNNVNIDSTDDLTLTIDKVEQTATN